MAINTIVSSEVAQGVIHKRPGQGQGYNSRHPSVDTLERNDFAIIRSGLGWIVRCPHNTSRSAFRHKKQAICYARKQWRKQYQEVAR